MPGGKRSTKVSVPFLPGPGWFSRKCRTGIRKVRTKSMRADRASFTGTACSQGVAEGEVLVVREPSPETDTKDRVLVARMTDPGWVFLIAGAKPSSLKGSLLSHTAIISRELGKPAVVGIPHITEYLKDGDRVRVDGDSGTVTLL